MKKIVALAIFALAPAAWAQQHAALSEGGEPCVKAECESGQVANQCPQPVNFARCHAADLGGCLLTETVRIESGETLPFACAPGKIARVGGCFPPFIPVSVSGAEHICAPDPKDPDALAAANAQAPQAAPKPAPAAKAPAPAPKQECEMDSLLQAAGKNNIAAARCLLESGADVNAKNNHGWTPMDLAIHWGHAEMQSLLSRHGGKAARSAQAPQAAPKPECGVDSLLQAAGKNNIAAARCLLESGADVNAKNNHGWTPMDLAIHWGHAEMQSLLSRHGGKAARFAQAPQAAPKPAPAAKAPAPAPKSECEMDSLHQAAEENNTAAARCLIKNGANVNAKGRGDYTPLHWAALRNATEMAALLIKHGARVGARNNLGYTPLHMAALNSGGRTETAALLLENGADVNATDNANATPTDSALFVDNADMRRFFQQYGGHCNTHPDC